MTHTVETTTPAARRPAVGVLRRWAPWALLLVVAAVVGGLLATPTSTGQLEPANRGRDGGAALAQVLERQGVRVDVVEGSTRLTNGSTSVGPGTTVLLPHTAYLGPEGGAALLEALAPADRLVVLVPTPEQAPQLGDDIDVDVDWIARGPLAADCATGPVRRDDVLSTADALLSAGGAERAQAEACFPPGAGHNLGGARDGALLTWPATAQRPETVVASTTTAWTNAQVTEEANAALALRLLGGSERLVWVLPQPGDAGLDAPAGLWDVLPRHLTSWVWLLGTAVVALALWRGRRLGPVVVEPLPAVVPAGETTRSRGRLYRQARDREHALAAIRAGTRRRIAPLLGLPPATDPDRLVAAAAEATARPAGEVAALLAQRRPVRDDADLVTGARALHALEEQVRTATSGH
ncbi:DUF4350 domain-containing protein [Ornithinimicrobium sufpigmenti]|uniref:DUF4350 domain-containing protein n=1 Tax=Ornithinimicrobium sufpigmenti TaxID=2508882 RepID=UPI0010363514|nr:MULTISPECIES: DUF4350 domain-containing protein [unclassified Ornithinimicrobium]